MSNSFNLFVIAIALLNIVGCLWLIWWTARSRGVAQSTANDGARGAEPQKTGHVWDGDIEEYNNPMPRWWAWSFVLSIVFGLGYLALYPGLGNLAGKLEWTAAKQHATDSAIERAALEERIAPFKALGLEALSRDHAAMSLAANLFAANCSTCHGSDARGARGFPNLTDNDWLYGGEPQTIYETIANGRHGVMPALSGALGSQGVNEAAAYVVSLNHHDAPQDWVSAGKIRFATICAACHGADAKGNRTLGAPNLTDNIWLYGGDFKSVHASIDNGHDHEMPAHLQTLGEAKVRLLAAYVISLGSKVERAEQNEDRRVDTHVR